MKFSFYKNVASLSQSLKSAISFRATFKIVVNGPIKYGVLYVYVGTSCVHGRLLTRDKNWNLNMYEIQVKKASNYIRCVVFHTNISKYMAL